MQKKDMRGEKKTIECEYAHMVDTGLCGDPNCHNLHIVLMDKDGKQMGAASLSFGFLCDGIMALAEKSGITIDELDPIPGGSSH